jgi:hypothetical protein
MKSKERTRRRDIERRSVDDLDDNNERIIDDFVSSDAIQLFQRYEISFSFFCHSFFHDQLEILQANHEQQICIREHCATRRRICNDQTIRQIL